MKIKITVEVDSIEEAQNILTGFTIDNPASPGDTPENKFVGGPVNFPPIPESTPPILDFAKLGQPPVMPIMSPAGETTHVPITHPAAVELDANNLPWDERIHSSSKTKTAKNIWTRRKNITNDLVTKVEAELRTGAFSQPSTVAAETVLPPAAPSGPFVRSDFTPPAPPIPAAPVAGVNTFQNLMTTIAGLFTTQGITPDYVKTLTDAISKGFNKPVNAITDIIADQAMIDYAFVVLKHDGKIA